MHENIDALRKWIIEYGGTIHPSICIKDGSLARGVFASAPLRKGEVVLQIPDCCVLFRDKVHDEFSPSIQLILAFMKEYRKRKESSFAYFIATLPKELDLLLDWEQSEINLLRGTSLHSLASQDASGKLLLKYFQDRVRVKLTEDYEDDEFLYSAKVVTSRAFGDANTSDGPFLIPFVDFLNHSNEKKCTTLRRCEDLSCFFMQAERDILEGEELFHSYGQHLTNGQLLQTYGFVSDEAGVSSCAIDKKLLISACKSIVKEEYQNIAEYSWARRIAALEDNFPCRYFILRESYSFEPRFLTSLCILLMPTDAFKEYDKDPFLLNDSIMHDPVLGTAVCMAVMKVVDERLSQYPMNLKSSIYSMQSINPKSREAKALKLRIEELHLLLALRQLALLHLENQDENEDDYEGRSNSISKRKRLRLSSVEDMKYIR